jgi:RNA polymerase sigma-70 factor (sigma-E family)
VDGELDARASFEEYVRARTPALSRVAFLLTGDHHLAEDLVQQTLLRVADRWPKLAVRGDPDAYVRRVLYHQHISWWRRRRAAPARGEDAAARDDRAAPDPGDAVVVGIAVRRALAQLAPGQRAVLVLRYFEDLSEAQTAQVLGISVGTVKSQARDGLARLRALAPELASLMEVEA